MGLRSSAPTSHPDGSPLVNGDTYLNTTDTKLYKYSSGTWNALDDNSAEWWSAMGDALNYVGQTGTQIQAANIWVNKLVAGTILADSIKTNILTADNIKAISGVFQDITVTGGFVVTKGIQGKYITPVEGVTFLNNVNNALKDYEKGVYNANGIIYMKAGNPFDEEDDYNLTVVINSIEKSTLFNDTFIRGYWYDNTGKIRGEVSINTRTGSVTHPWDWGPPPPSTIIKDVFNYKIII